MLAKVTFVFFFCVIGLAFLVIRQDYSGERSLWYSVAACIVGSMPAILIWRFYWLSFLRFAWMAAWGEQARWWSVPGMTAGGYLERYFSQLGLALIPLSILLGLFIRGIWIEKQMRLARLLPVCIILGYLGIAARSQNRDPRFGIPIMIAMPLCLAWTGIRKESKLNVGSAPVLAALLMGTVIALPMIGRPESAPIRRAGDLLRTLSQKDPIEGHPTRVMIATDGPAFNIDTFLLARQLGGDSLQPVDLDTLVYDAINKRSLEDGLRRIDAAAYVLFFPPHLAP